MASIHDAAGIAELRARWRIEPNCLRWLRGAFYKKHETAEEALLHIPETQRDAFSAAVAFHALTLESRHDSRRDGASKLTGRTSVCVSSQVGCAVRCTFCATGRMGLVKNLTQAEILDQVIQTNQLLRPEQRTVRNVVFMGMGEPFQNEDEVYKAVEVLVSPACFSLSPAHVVISTVGIPDAMVRCAERFPRLSLALSLHSARQKVRERLIPLARRYPLNQLREAMVRVTTLQDRPLMIEYLLLDGLNDTDDDLDALGEFLGRLPVHINLIPYNRIDDAPGLRGTPTTRQRTFADSLVAAGFKVTTRYSLGADITAACGQLCRAETRSSSIAQSGSSKKQE